jgi:hypothetical protein
MGSAMLIGRLGLSLASLCAVASACVPPAASPHPALPRSVGEALSTYQDEYEVGWMTATGEIAYSQVTGVVLDANGEVRVELAEPSLLWGTAGPRTFSGRWQDAGGSGELWFQFVADFSSAAGWWNEGQETEKRELWLRKSR